MIKKNICFIWTVSNGDHQTDDQPNKRHLYEFARLVKLDFIFGTWDNNDFKIVKSGNYIIDNRYRVDFFGELPQVIHELDKSENKITYDKFIVEFNKILDTTNVIVVHDANHHMKTIISESIRANIPLRYDTKLLIDTISFKHDLDKPTIHDLAKKLKIKSEKEIELLKNIFIKLYKS